jgi:hypothetical protein
VETPFQLSVTLARPAAQVGEEPQEPVYARVRVETLPSAPVPSQLDLCFVLDASASMHRFVLDPEQRAMWQQRAEQRGEVSRQQADGRTGMVWTGQTLRELQQVVSTPMLSTLRGVWRTFEALAPTDRAAVLAFADKPGVIYEDAGVPDQPSRMQTAKTSLARLGSGVDESGLGRGTRLAGALEHALSRLEAAGDAHAVRRMVLVSDGIIEDVDECQPLLDRAVDRGLVISVIGVGEEFDEEYLMMVADLTRGSYYYAATAVEVEKAVAEELEIVRSIIARRGALRVLPANGTLICDVFPVAPALSEFQTVWIEDGSWRFQIGDLSAAQKTEFLLSLAPPAHDAGHAELAAVRVEALGAGGAPAAAETTVRLYFSDESMLLQARDDEVLDTVRRLEIYREERRAALAAAEGDVEGSTRHLKAATRMLRSMGADALAEEMDAAADEAQSGTRNLGRTKRVKAETRRLGG